MECVCVCGGGGGGYILSEIINVFIGKLEFCCHNNSTLNKSILIYWQQVSSIYINNQCQLFLSIRLEQQLFLI